MQNIEIRDILKRKNGKLVVIVADEGEHYYSIWEEDDIDLHSQKLQDDDDFFKDNWTELFERSQKRQEAAELAALDYFYENGGSKPKEFYKEAAYGWRNPEEGSNRCIRRSMAKYFQDSKS
jgi:hypothetical protein